MPIDKCTITTLKGRDLLISEGCGTRDQGSKSQLITSCDFLRSPCSRLCVVRGLAIDALRPAIHMLLKVELPEGNYLTDVGFGRRPPWVISGNSRPEHLTSAYPPLATK
jgi:hypothetical protein